MTLPNSPLEQLTEDELAVIVGGADVKGFDAQRYAYDKIGMCGCGFAH